jgi:hypothetical protein
MTGTPVCQEMRRSFDRFLTTCCLTEENISVKRYGTFACDYVEWAHLKKKG